MHKNAAHLSCCLMVSEKICKSVLEAQIFLFIMSLWEHMTTMEKPLWSPAMVDRVYIENSNHHNMLNI